MVTHLNDALPRVLVVSLAPAADAAKYASDRRRRTLMYRTLEYLRGISDADIRRLRATGIRHTNQLLHRTSLDIDRQRLSKRTGISAERLLGFAHQCTLMEVSGMERHRQTVRRFGIETVKDLRAQDADDLHRKLVDAVGLAGAPSHSDVQYWISQATALDIIEGPEGPPPRPLVM